jgi:hypothetical protein
MQTPLPPGMISPAIPVFGIIMVIAITGFVTLGPIGRAIGRVALHLFGVDRQQALPTGEVAQLRDLIESQADRVEALQRQVGELAERQDFAERLLAQVRDKQALPKGQP